MSNIDTDLLVREHLQTGLFAESLADHVAMKFSEKLLDEFHNKVNREMDKRVKAMVAEYIDVYTIEKNIQDRVRQAVDKLTKEEVLKLLGSNHD